MLRYVTLLYRARFKRSGVSNITYQHVGDALEDDRELFEFLSYDVSGRSFPSRGKLENVDPSVITVLLRILTHGSLEFNKDDVAMDKCFRMGSPGPDLSRYSDLDCESIAEILKDNAWHGRTGPAIWPFWAATPSRGSLPG